MCLLLGSLSWFLPVFFLLSVAWASRYFYWYLVWSQQLTLAPGVISETYTGAWYDPRNLSWCLMGPQQLTLLPGMISETYTSAWWDLKNIHWCPIQSQTFVLMPGVISDTHADPWCELRYTDTGCDWTAISVANWGWASGCLCFFWKFTLFQLLLFPIESHSLFNSKKRWQVACFPLMVSQEDDMEGGSHTPCLLQTLLGIPLKHSVTVLPTPLSLNLPFSASPSVPFFLIWKPPWCTTPGILFKS